MLKGGAILTLLIGVVTLPFLVRADQSRELETKALDRKLEESDRAPALSALGRIDPRRAAAVASNLLQDPQPHVRLAAARICMRAGNENGERALTAMLKDPGLEPGFRGLAALALGRERSKAGHSEILRVATEETETARAAARQRLPLRTHLIEALAEYRQPADFPVAASLFRADYYSGAVELIGLFGLSEAQPILREALAREKNAGSVIAVNVALSRSGGDDGVRFVRELIRRTANIKGVSGGIDLRQEDPLSGRLGGDLLRQLGDSPADKQFLPDVLWLLRQSPCDSCLTAWGAVARIGISGHEDEIVEIALSVPAADRDRALQALAYSGASTHVKRLAKEAGMIPAGDAYLKRHEEGADREWFKARSRLLD